MAMSTTMPAFSSACLVYIRRLSYSRKSRK